MLSNLVKYIPKSLDDCSCKINYHLNIPLLALLCSVLILSSRSVLCIEEGHLRNYIANSSLEHIVVVVRQAEKRHGKDKSKHRNSMIGVFNRTANGERTQRWTLESKWWSARSSSTALEPPISETDFGTVKAHQINEEDPYLYGYESIPEGFYSLSEDVWANGKRCFLISVFPFDNGVLPLNFMQKLRKVHSKQTHENNLLYVQEDEPFDFVSYTKDECYIHGSPTQFWSHRDSWGCINLNSKKTNELMSDYDDFVSHLPGFVDRGNTALLLLDFSDEETIVLPKELDSEILDVTWRNTLKRLRNTLPHMTDIEAKGFTLPYEIQAYDKFGLSMSTAKVRATYYDIISRRILDDQGVSDYNGKFFWKKNFAVPLYFQSYRLGDSFSRTTNAHVNKLSSTPVALRLEANITNSVKIMVNQETGRCAEVSHVNFKSAEASFTFEENPFSSEDCTTILRGIPYGKYDVEVKYDYCSTTNHSVDINSDLHIIESNCLNTGHLRIHGSKVIDGATAPVSYYLEIKPIETLTKETDHKSMARMDGSFRYRNMSPGSYLLIFSLEDAVLQREVIIREDRTLNGRVVFYEDKGGQVYDAEFRLID